MERDEHVRVRSRFDGRWSHGFVLVDKRNDHLQQQFKVKRVSDGAVLPGVFSSDEVKPEDQ